MITRWLRCLFQGIAYQYTEKVMFLLMQIRYLNIVWNDVPKFHENHVSRFWDMRQSMCIIVLGGYHSRGRGAQTRSLSVQKNEKITRTVFFMIDIKSFSNWEWPGGVICSEKWENLKNSTHTKIKLYIFFSMIDIKIFTYGRRGANGRRWALSVQKN